MIIVSPELFLGSTIEFSIEFSIELAIPSFGSNLDDRGKRMFCTRLSPPMPLSFLVEAFSSKTEKSVTPTIGCTLNCRGNLESPLRRTESRQSTGSTLIHVALYDVLLPLLLRPER